MGKGVVIIPTYNEIENIESIIKAVFSLATPFRCFNCRRQFRLTERLPKYSNCKTITRNCCIWSSGKKRQAWGLLTRIGFKWALQRDFEYIFEMDADFSHNPADLEKLYQACSEGADMSIGSRYVTGVNVVNWPLSRVLLSYFASVYVNLITGMKIHDTTAGFVCYKRKVLETINLDRIKFIGYAFQIEMKYRTFLKQFKIVEVPIIFTDRTKGQSKMSNAIIKEAIFGVISLRIRKMLNRL